jgi:hypothetical protein
MQLLEMGQQVLSTRHPYESDWVDSGAIKGFRSASLSFIERVYGTEHTHYKEFSSNTDGYRPEDASMGVAILQAIKTEIEGGWLFSLKGLVAAELFADFIEMAEHLLEAGYKDPSAVILGSVLEGHTRQLCQNNSIDIEEYKDGKPVPKKADRLNSDLAKANVYSKLDQKMVTAWLDLRNKAAHGKYTEYNEDQVQQLIRGVTEFVARVSVQ